MRRTVLSTALHTAGQLPEGSQALVPGTGLEPGGVWCTYMMFILVVMIVVMMMMAVMMLMLLLKIVGWRTPSLLLLLRKDPVVAPTHRDIFHISL